MYCGSCPVVPAYRMQETGTPWKPFCCALSSQILEITVPKCFNIVLIVLWKPSDQNMNACRAASKTTPRTDASDASLQAQLFPARKTPQSSTARSKLRQVMLELANSDAFLDLIAEKLQSGGVQL